MKAKRTSKLKRAGEELPTARSQQRLVRRIKRVANEMRQLGAHMVYFGGFVEIGEHGHEMLRAAVCAESWATALEQNPPNDKAQELVPRTSDSDFSDNIGACAPREVDVDVAAGTAAQ